MEPQVQKVVDKILQDAKEQAMRIVNEARGSAEIILEHQQELARQKAADEVASILTKARDEAKILVAIEESEAKRKANWMILSEKERLISNTLDEVRTKLTAFSNSKKYVPFLQKIIIDAGVALGGGKLEILLSEKDSALPLSSSSLSRTVAEKTGAKTEFRLSDERIKASGGTVIRLADGKILVDNTFDAMVQRNERHLRLTIAKILFE